MTAGVALLVAGGGTAYWLTRPEPAAARAATTTVTRETLKETVSATGTISPAKQADLGFAVPGTVIAVLVHEGQRVTKGDVLARVDDSLLAADVTARESALDAAETRLADDLDADASDTQLASDRAAVVSAESQLAQAEEALENATLRSTINGTVAEVNLEAGDAADASDTGIVVVSSRRFVVDAQVGTGDVERVRKNLQVEITPTGATEPVYGTVKAVGRVAVAQDDGAATFPVTVEVTGRRPATGAGALYAGSSATVEIIVKQVDDVLAVPSMALRQDGETTYVYKLVDGRRVRTAVQTGQTFGASTEVRSGLSEGDEVEVMSFTRAPGGGTGQRGDVTLPPGGMVFQDSGPTGPGVSTEKAP